MKVTIKDVAKEAGVSTSTVSRVLSDSSKISFDTKEKVNKAIKKLKYKPNIIARSLVNNKTKTLGIVFNNEAGDSFSNPFFVQAMKGISIYAQEKGYYILYVFSKNEEDKLKNIKDFSSNGMVDGIILLKAEKNDKAINYLLEKEFPFVVIGRPEESSLVLWVDNDNFSATYNITNKLINKGYKSIAFISANKEWNVSKDRLSGYKEALKNNGIKINTDIILHRKAFNEVEGFKSIEKIFKKRSIEAILATDDLLAFGANEFLKKNNIKNIAIVGFNNTPLAKYQNPSISSIDINAIELGYGAAKLLICKLENKILNCNNYIVETKFVERDSFRKANDCTIIKKEDINRIIK
ncbi:LacI family DNA-binding transcriptional regulator [Clostridium tarantellae]|uniref:LacI family DNA-binding transcriptional regulator n=1 Tax=Clostridium tarantellae TaxID=39493 RepID=A0A6I1MKT9_9CLOT|nr:LacI family DNA-binding transcriptional regulator [Clostridium tarantellae]MPQ44015.1 LacI family DNA-binding transcriptional regulator [Clostridium tarantellae]